MEMCKCAFLQVFLLAFTKEYWKQALLEMEAALTEENFCVWDKAFTRERFAKFLRMNLMELLKAGEEQIQLFVLVLRRILYEKQEGLVCRRQ